MGDVAIRELSRNEYAAFLETIPHSAFHRLAWLDAVTGVYTLRIRLLGYMRDSQLCAVTPLMGRRMGPLMLWGAPLRKCGTPPATPFCSPPGEVSAVLPVFRQWATKQRFGYLQITIPEEPEVQTRKDERVEPLDNLELDLDRPLESIWRILAQQKSAVRKAVRSGVRIHFQTAPDFLRIQDDLLAATYERQQLHPNFPRSLYRAILETRKQNGLRLLSAVHQGKTIASIWTFTDASSCYYWDAASLPEARDLNANHLLVWSLIRWAHRKGLHTLDFVGTSVGGRGGSRPGIGRFKQSMGGRPSQYRILYRFSPLTRAAFFGYRWLTRLRLGPTERNCHAGSP
jgi:hypothetical protein